MGHQCPSAPPRSRVRFPLRGSPSSHLCAPLGPGLIFGVSVNSRVSFRPLSPLASRHGGRPAPLGLLVPCRHGLLSWGDPCLIVPVGTTDSWGTSSRPRPPLEAWHFVMGGGLGLSPPAFLSLISAPTGMVSDHGGRPVARAEHSYPPWVSESRVNCQYHRNFAQFHHCLVETFCYRVLEGSPRSHVFLAVSCRYRVLDGTRTYQSDFGGVSFRRKCSGHE